MKVIITGGTGLIGQALAEDLAADGHDVILLSRSTGTVVGLSTSVRVEKWDGRTATGWGHLVEGADAIVNLAGANLSAGRWTAKRKQEILQSRQDPGAAVVQAVQAAKNKPAVVVQVAAIGYYGSSETELFDEEDGPGTDFLASVCQEWEASTKGVEDLGVRRVVVRMAVVLSKKGGALPRMLLPFKLFVGGPIGSGKQWMSWVHLADAVRALRFLIETPQAQGVVNLSATPLTNRQLSKIIGKVLHRPSFIPVPAFVLKLLFGEMSMVLLDGQRVSSKRLESLGFQFRYPEAEAALMDLLHKKA